MSKRNIVGIVTEMERDEISDICEKKYALENLMLIIDSKNVLRKKVINDYEEVVKLYNNWWKRYKEKYSWQEGALAIDFNTCQVFEE